MTEDQMFRMAALVALVCYLVPAAFRTRPRVTRMLRLAGLAIVGIAIGTALFWALLGAFT